MGALATAISSETSHNTPQRKIGAAEPAASAAPKATQQPIWRIKFAMAVSLAGKYAKPSHAGQRAGDAVSDQSLANGPIARLPQWGQLLFKPMFI